MTDQYPYLCGIIVSHPRKPEWGPGRILLVEGPKVTVYFRDIPGPHPEEAVRTIDTRVIPLNPADKQSDPLLDNLPPYANGKFHRPPRRRVTLDEGIEKFRAFCPLFFEDPKYLELERAYKWAAHEQWHESLGGGRLAALLSEGRIDEARRHAQSVEGHTNLLSIFEKAAFRDALREDKAATLYLSALDSLLTSPALDRGSFEAYLDAVASLPSKEGKTSPAKWTIATILPFLAHPDRFMFLKPEVTQDCAARLMVDLNYRTELNWVTYAKLMEMSEYLLQVLRQYGARDFVDVQSFIWMIGGGWE